MSNLSNFQKAHEPGGAAVTLRPLDFKEVEDQQERFAEGEVERLKRGNAGKGATPVGWQFSRLGSADDPHRDGRDDWMSAVGNIETASGLRYSFEDPDPETILLEDIAHALSNVCRFAGHIRRFNSVAEHSVLVSRIVEAYSVSKFHNAIHQEDIVRAALLHDAHEAYIWDAPSPVKPLLGDTFKRLGRIADEAIAGKFLREGYSADTFKNEFIKAADRTALVVEGRALLSVGPTDAEWEPLPRGVQWDGGLTPYEAKTLYLTRAKELGL